MSSVYATYARSLTWLAALAAFVGGLVGAMWGINYISAPGPLGITLGSAIGMMLAAVLIPALYMLISALLIFTAAQCVQAVLVGCLVRRLGTWANSATVLVLPITAILTWYSFDYLAGFDLPLPHGPETRRLGSL